MTEKVPLTNKPPLWADIQESNNPIQLWIEVTESYLRKTMENTIASTHNRDSQITGVDLVVFRFVDTQRFADLGLRV